MKSITKRFHRTIAAAVTALAITSVQALPITPISEITDTAIIASAASYTPAKVAGVKASDVSYTTATLKWNKVSNAKGYRIYVYDPSSKKYKKVITITKNTTEYKLTNLIAGTAYKFKLRAYRQDNGSTYWGKCSNVFTLTTRSYDPGKVTGCTAKASSATSGTLSWNKVSKASGYRVYVYNVSTKKYTKVTTLSGNSKTSCKVTGLKAGTSYKYKIRAYRKVNGVTYWGASSSAVTLKTVDSKTELYNSLSATDKAYVNVMNAVPSDKDLELIRQDLCNYAINKWKGKTEMTISDKECEYFTSSTYTRKYSAPISVARNETLHTEFTDFSMGVNGPENGHTTDFIEWDGTYHDLEVCKARCYNIMDDGMADCFDEECYDGWTIYINAGFTWKTKGAYYNGKYHKKYWVWFIDGDDQIDERRASFDEDTLYG